MIVYFHIDEITRDLITAAALKKKLDNHPNIKLFFGNRTLNNIISRFKLYKLFDLFIIPNVDFIKDIFKNPENIKEKKILILYSECTGSILNDQKRSSYHFFGSDFGKTGSKKWLRAINYFLLCYLILSCNSIYIMNDTSQLIQYKYNVFSTPLHNNVY
jgi:hypothetical protein